MKYLTLIAATLMVGCADNADAQEPQTVLMEAAPSVADTGTCCDVATVPVVFQPVYYVRTRKHCPVKRTVRFVKSRPVKRWVCCR